MEGSIYMLSEFLGLPAVPPIEQLMYLAYQLVDAGEADTEAETLTDVILDYDYRHGIIYASFLEMDSKRGYYASFPVVTMFPDGFSQIGYILEEEKEFQYYGQEGGTTTTSVASTSVEFQQNIRKSSCTKNLENQESQDERFKNGKNGRRFYAKRSTKHCVFCRKNGEPQSLYKTHVLRENGIITCPILRKYICPVCNASGGEAHTLKHCPKNKGDSAIAGRHEISRSGRNARGILGKTYRYE